MGGQLAYVAGSDFGSADATVGINFKIDGEVYGDDIECTPICESGYRGYGVNCVKVELGDESGTKLEDSCSDGDVIYQWSNSDFKSYITDIMNDSKVTEDVYLPLTLKRIEGMEPTEESPCVHNWVFIDGSSVPEQTLPVWQDENASSNCDSSFTHAMFNVTSGSMYAVEEFEVGSYVVCANRGSVEDTIDDTLDVRMCEIPIGVGTSTKVDFWSASRTTHFTSFEKLDSGYHRPVISNVSVKNGDTLKTDGDVVVIEGQYFGPMTADLRHNKPISASFGPEGDFTRYVIDSCTHLVDDSKIECITPPGMGKDHSWIVTIGDQSSEKSEQMTSFDAPIIIGVDGVGVENALTTGGQSITISASQGFGPENTKLVEVYYGRYNGGEGHSEPPPMRQLDEETAAIDTRPIDEIFKYVFKAESCTFKSGDVQLLNCLTGEGFGKDLSYLVIVDGQRAPIYHAMTSYSAPMVVAYDNEGSLDALTKGDQIIDISGRNFGNLSDVIDSVQYFTKPDDVDDEPEYVFEATACEITVPHEKIRCRTAAGAGNNLEWRVYIDGQMSTVALTNYVIPTITDVCLNSAPASMDTPCDKPALNTNGGEIIILRGENFGAVQTNVAKEDRFLKSVTFGDSGTGFTATDCEVIVAHSQVQCTTVPGYGNELEMVINVADQFSPLTFEFGGYAKPEITDVQDNIVSTAGQKSVKILGNNFSLKSLVARQYISWPVNGGLEHLIPTSGGVNEDGSNWLLVDIPAGESNDWEITVKVGTSLAKFLESEPYDFHYLPPEITGLSVSTLATQIDTVSIEIQGTDFGRRINGEVIITPESGESFTATTISSWTDTTIELTSKVKEGKIQVIAGNQVSEEKVYEEKSPLLLPNWQVGDTDYVNVDEFSTEGGDLMTLQGRDFGDPASISIEVYNDGVLKFCTNISKVNGTVNNAKYGEVEEISCEVPEGYGSRNEIKIKRNGQASKAGIYIRYKVPSVDLSKSELCELNLDGEFDCELCPNKLCQPNTVGSYIKLYGSDFGPAYVAPVSDSTADDDEIPAHSTSVGVYLSDCSHAPLPIVSQTHSELILKIPPSEGLGKISITVGDQNVPEAQKLTYKYAPPVVSGINPPNLPTNGGIIKISGYNFGTQGFDIPSGACTRDIGGSQLPDTPLNTALIGGQVCNVIEYTSFEIKCELNEGFGADKKSLVTIAGRESNNNILFSYDPPLIESISSNSQEDDVIYPTSGFRKDRGEEPVVVTITGTRFVIWFLIKNKLDWGFIFESV
eukprot:TRINITY_DN5821_c0_g1_i7.p1 TRINITY_DN5821_c0_g1~~TRINITY_DN5821_c0_g1_i7.p1  ORF type:complete len:1339 (-),score=489.15 TRINITY_DN5821_c0_g1_i7:101-3892(-)